MGKFHSAKESYNAADQQRLEAEGKYLVFANGKNGYFTDAKTASYFTDAEASGYFTDAETAKVLTEGDAERKIQPIFSNDKNSPHYSVAYGSLITSPGMASAAVSNAKILVIDDEQRSHGNTSLIDARGRAISPTQVEKLYDKMGDGTMLISSELMRQLSHPMTSQLDRIERLLLESKLGFSSGSQRVPVYCNRSKGGLWYTLDKVGDDLVPMPIQGDRLTCYLEGLLIKSVTRKKKGECDKFRLYVKGDRPYVLESGWSTLPKEQSFAKGLIWTIAHMSPQQLQQPVILNPHPGEEDGVMFCRVIQGGKSIYVERHGEPDWEEVLERAIANLEQATGRSFREKPEEAPPEEMMPDSLAQAPEPSEMPFMDGVNQMLNSLDDIEKCRQSYYWVTDRAI